MFRIESFNWNGPTTTSRPGSGFVPPGSSLLLHRSHKFNPKTRGLFPTVWGSISLF